MYHVVADAVGGCTPETIPNFTDIMIHLASVLEDTNTRLIFVGGAGSLFVNKERTITVDMGPDFPESWNSLSNAHGAGLKALRESEILIGLIFILLVTLLFKKCYKTKKKGKTIIRITLLIKDVSCKRV